MTPYTLVWPDTMPMTGGVDQSVSTTRFIECVPRQFTITSKAPAPTKNRLPGEQLLRPDECDYSPKW